ncbi:carboxypeptidase B-like isoform X2 [Cydia fagiglandana]|uniref:carboxypeptidase B-like isoform X2 n=1 Tax=Cydia fagiglandana TaxID=1458189 RepID=UPI002FEDF2B0
MDFFVDKPRVAQVASMLHERGIPFSVSIRDVDELRCREQGSSITVNLSTTERPGHSKDAPCGCMNWKSYHGLRTIYNFLDKLAETHPYLCNTCIIGKTCEGRDIKLLMISNGCPSNKAVWLDGGIHAREWVSVAVVTYIANEIVQNFNKMPESVTNKDWYVLSVVNPDGYVYTHTTDRMWRKNRSQYGQCAGVDLNRNFSVGWGEAGEDGSSEDPGSIFYRGPKPFSEPETAAIKKVIHDSKTDFRAFLSFHSYGEVIIFPWGYTSDPCPSYVELLEGGTVMARAIHAVNGRTYKVGSTKDIMYYSAGTSVDWSYGSAKIPYSYMIELPSKQHRFLLPKDQIIPTAKEVFCGVIELMQFIDRRRTGKSQSATSCRATASCPPKPSSIKPVSCSTKPPCIKPISCSPTPSFTGLTCRSPKPSCKKLISSSPTPSFTGLTCRSPKPSSKKLNISSSPTPSFTGLPCCSPKPSRNKPICSPTPSFTALNSCSPIPSCIRPNPSCIRPTSCSPNPSCIRPNTSCRPHSSCNL